ncbi:MAG: 3-hydroxybutyryl-CoA dehydrogenase [Chloroflexi bacterium 13_1_40CM_4_68_4]|nr:MAG: 3-hydroxybutyryl-CoA dehydrogenase [Chloroflexi bacterium 13_1_40CM_4_68_4]
MKPDEVKSIGVVGGGTMGSGIAQTCATAGLQVVLVDLALEQLTKAQGAINASLAKLQAKQQLPADSATIAGRIRTSTNVEDLRNVDLAIEAAFEDPALKEDLFRKLDQACKADAVLVSNTSSISITRLAAATKRPERVAGMHFMNPVPLMQLVEVVRALQTSDETIAFVKAVAERLGKTAVESRDVPGFISNRVLMPLINEAFFALDERVGSAEDIDTVMRLGMNHPMGPLALADLIGLDVCLAVLQVLQRDLGEDKYRPAPLLRSYVSAGWLGRKSGRGVYSYD